MDYTQAQIGDATAPGVHAASAIPGVVAGAGGRDELPDAAINYAPREARSWRGRQLIGQAADAVPTDVDAGVVLLPGDPHTWEGAPDPREVWGGFVNAGETGAPIEAQRPGGLEQLVSVQDIHVNADVRAIPIDRPRAGLTSADPARPARLPLWTFLRPFDQWAQYGAGVIDKVPMPSPLASRPLAYTMPVPDSVPSAGGDGPTGMTPTETTPSNVRYVPRPWDALIATQDTNGSEFDASLANIAKGRAGGWRVS